MDPSRLTMALWGNGYAPENDAISFARQKDREGARGELAQALAGTWPVQMAKSAVGAAALPGDVYAGRVDPMSQQGIERAADLAGFTTLGSFAASRPAGSIGMGGMPEKPGIRAYHGSPHDFDKFDLSKIGTGEGAQAYGHGLYFAEAEDVARNYRDALTPKKNTTLDGAKPNPDDPAHMASVMLQKFNGDRDAAMAWMRGSDTMKPIYDELASGRPLPSHEMTPGKMYEVNIRANPDDFLDWDKPLAEQSEAVQNFAGQLKDKSFLARKRLDDADTAAGRDVWEKARNAFGIGDADAATKALREAGIPGIKYLDQGSRAAGDGSRNYVVFDDKLIEILRKYGLTGLLGLGAAGGAYQSQTQEGGT